MATLSRAEIDSKSRHVICALPTGHRRLQFIFLVRVTPRGVLYIPSIICTAGEPFSQHVCGRARHLVMIIAQIPILLPFHFPQEA